MFQHSVTLNALIFINPFQILLFKNAGVQNVHIILLRMNFVLVEKRSLQLKSTHQPIGILKVSITCDDDGVDDDLGVCLVFQLRTQAGLWITDQRL